MDQRKKKVLTSFQRLITYLGLALLIWLFGLLVFIPLSEFFPIVSWFPLLDF